MSSRIRRHSPSRGSCPPTASTGSGCRHGVRRRSPRTAANRCGRWDSTSEQSAPRSGARRLRGDIAKRVAEAGHPIRVPASAFVLRWADGVVEITAPEATATVVIVKEWNPTFQGEPLTIIAAADGSALGNPGPAGWAWYIDDGCWHAGGWKNATNNRGELMAVLDLLRSTADSGEDLKVFCDSQYVINALTKWMPGWKRRGWKKADGKDVLNKDLLELLDVALRGREVEFEWVKGHSNHAMNEAADERARAAATAFQKGTSVPEGPGYVPAGAAESVTELTGASA